jgi:copper chaperone CopZ
MASVSSALEKVEGIENFKLALKPPTARLIFDDSRLTIQALMKAVKSAGNKYDARLMLRVEGDQQRIASELAKVPGLRSAGQPNSEGVRLVTFHADRATSYSQILDAVKAADAKLLPPVEEPKSEKPGG